MILDKGCWVEEAGQETSRNWNNGLGCKDKNLIRNFYAVIVRSADDWVGSNSFSGHTETAVGWSVVRRKRVQVGAPSAGT